MLRKKFKWVCLTKWDKWRHRFKYRASFSEHFSLVTPKPCSLSLFLFLVCFLCFVCETKDFFSFSMLLFSQLCLCAYVHICVCACMWEFRKIGRGKRPQKIESCFDFFAKQKSKFSLLDFTKSRNRDRQTKRDVITGKRKSEIFAQFVFCGQGTLKNLHFFIQNKGPKI